MFNLSGTGESNSNRVCLSSKAENLVQQAWEIRTANFPMEMTVVNPVKTKAVSVTGNTCALDCAHCGKHYLKGMRPLEAVLPGENPAEESTLEKSSLRPASYLISGGCTSQGKVPLLQHLDQLYELKKSARLNLHTGLVTIEEAHALAAVADVVSFDFVGSDDIIQKVYGLDKKVSDYLDSYRSLAAALGSHRVVPHVTIGLAAGKVSTEVEAVKLLAAEGISELALLVFRPTRGTRFEKLPAPDLAEVAATMAKIRTQIPSVPINLGCMRPGGGYRSKLDLLALHCGLNKIVHPGRNFEAAARQMGLTVKYEEECCAL